MTLFSGKGIASPFSVSARLSAFLESALNTICHEFLTLAGGAKYHRGGHFHDQAATESFMSPEKERNMDDRHQVEPQDIF